MEFFDSTPSGRIINRFSKDVEYVERSIPESLRITQNLFFQITCTLVLISIVTPLFLVAIIPIGLIYLFVRKYFIASIRQLRRMDSASKSPIFSHFTESLTGVSTIRAFKMQDRFSFKMEQKIDENSMYYLPGLMLARWLGLRLDLIKGLIVGLACLFAVLARDTINPGLAALSITYALSVTSFYKYIQI